MKEINIKIRINETDDKIATFWNLEGYDRKSISNQLEVLGIFENLVDLQKDKIKTLINLKKDR